MKITGTVVKGDGRGRELGWPTANIAVGAECTAPNGVYAAKVLIEGSQTCRGAMANLGVKPTFGGEAGERVLELHLFDYRGNLYGRRVQAELVAHIRPEQKFTTPEALARQIAKDEIIVKNILECL